ncbi:GDSL esterase/lipase At4g10955-like [Setaria viridis]|uniref:GDSL esterase/lipase At4g10955-like n=1 Tax=Setaria viridis TaxID=4556 RepID=UPI003B3B0AC9
MGSDSDKECFDKSGPKHISEIDWGNEGHRRCITACLCESHLHSGERSNQGEAGHTRGARAGVVEELPPAPDTCIRFRKACEHVAELLLEATGISGSGGVVWLAGHSLGASVALDVGRDLVIRRAPLNLPTFLFNPPHVSLAPVATALAAHVGGGQA